MTVCFIRSWLRQRAVDLNYDGGAISGGNDNGQVISYRSRRHLICIHNSGVQLLKGVKDTTSSMVLPIFSLNSGNNPFNVSVGVSPISSHGEVNNASVFRTRVSFSLAFCVTAVVNTCNVPTAHVLGGRSPRIG